MNIVLFLTAYLLFLPLSLLNYILVAKKGGYFRSSAVSLDQYGTMEFRSLFNKYLITETGILLVRFLDWLDRDHCFKSITEIR